MNKRLKAKTRAQARTEFTPSIKTSIKRATKNLCGLCMFTITQGGHVCHILDAANTEAESNATKLNIVGRHHQGNGLWLCATCHGRISYGRSIFCPPPQLIKLFTNELRSNPATDFRQVLAQPKAVYWLNYYLVVIPNINAHEIDSFVTRKPRKFKFVKDIGFLESTTDIEGEEYEIYDTDDPDSKLVYTDLVRDTKRCRRLWKLPHLDVHNVLLSALWQLKISSHYTSSNPEATRALGELIILLWQRQIYPSALTPSSTMDDKDAENATADDEDAENAATDDEDAESAETDDEDAEGSAMDDDEDEEE
ncbi:hypothetical protein B0H16DRAFT_1724501 [Mycena metata]|uniref:Uncharacterized protein n=1 Tax=Mycena metata TaxID=1033252 RepID=A0AAD7IU32_9AGAR|nr:hypothetical protein B0H16DRAFT_1724501 [Mycena metata]